MSQKNIKNDEATNSVIEVVEEGDVRRVIVAGKELQISEFDSGDYSWFDVTESDLKKIRRSDLPDSLVFNVEQKLCNKKIQIADIITFSKSDQPELVIEMLLYNKLWEGFFGLKAFLEALMEQINQVENFNVIRSELEDAHKEVSISCTISAEDLLIDLLNSVAEEFNQLIEQAEIALAKQGIELFQED